MQSNEHSGLIGVRLTVLWRDANPAHHDEVKVVLAVAVAQPLAYACPAATQDKD